MGVGGFVDSGTVGGEEDFESFFFREFLGDFLDFGGSCEVIGALEEIFCVGAGGGLGAGEGLGVRGVAGTLCIRGFLGVSGEADGRLL